MRIALITVLSAGLINLAVASGDHAGGDGKAAAHWMSPEAASKRVNPVKLDADSIARGAALFKQKCSSCHGATAKGDGPASRALTPKPSNLHQMSGLHPDGDFAWKIENGRGAMPPWKGSLKENQIWDLVNYIQSLAKMKKHESKGEHHSDHAH